ncbi:hypothetical protein VTN00DRAFT_4464 [Thermoascus crustaceus]|uniref:uncharacterized protein n=1 Tax=Thermoascus crustaceus TaxID=5088 RepID=UPI00374207D4
MRTVNANPQLTPTEDARLPDMSKDDCVVLAETQSGTRGEFGGRPGLMVDAMSGRYELPDWLQRRPQNRIF